MSSPFANRRHLGTTGYETPLLVPSYSSRGFSPLRPLYEALRDATTRLSLVSAYDIHHNALPIEAVYGSDLTFLDSGGYEAYASSELSEPKPWSEPAYRTVLDNLEDRSTVVAVSFDYRQRRPTTEQLDAAIGLRRDYPRLAWNWLVKPEGDHEDFVNVKAIAEALPAARGFDVVGVTADELGPSLSHRVGNVRALREGMIRAGLDIPIHIFGCLDPVVVPYYILAGADVFDGLQWLRSACRADGLIRLSSAVVQDGRVTESEEEVRMAYRRANVRLLQDMEAKWTRDILTGDGNLPQRIGVQRDVWAKLSGKGG